MKQHERMQLLVVWAEEKATGKGEKKKLGLPQPICQLFSLLAGK